MTSRCFPTILIGLLLLAVTPVPPFAFEGPHPLQIASIEDEDDEEDDDTPMAPQGRKPLQWGLHTPTREVSSGQRQMVRQKHGQSMRSARHRGRHASTFSRRHHRGHSTRLRREKGIHHRLSHPRASHHPVSHHQKRLKKGHQKAKSHSRRHRH